MWNNGNGNGNGQGNGYGQQPPQQGYYPQGGYNQPQDVYGRLDNAREVGGARFPYIDGGNHKLALVTLDEIGDVNNPKARALFKVLESRTMQPGSFCVKIWALVKPPKFQNGTSEADEFADFCLKLKNAPRGYPIGRDIRVLMKERTAEQLARGTVIDAVGVPNKKGNYVRVFWNPVQQTPQDIAAMRQRLEQEGIPNTGGGQQQQAPQGYAPQQPQMPPQGYGQPPQQPPQQPQGYGPPQQPPQGYAPNPGATVGNNAPVYQQPQGYPQQPQAPQGVPPGGFLANVPPQGNNGQGGNGGQGSW